MHVIGIKLNVSGWFGSERPLEVTKKSIGALMPCLKTALQILMLHQYSLLTVARDYHMEIWRQSV